MARTRSVEIHTPDGEHHVVERDVDKNITGVSDPLYEEDWKDEAGHLLPDFDPWDYAFEPENCYLDDEDRAIAATFLAGFDR